MTINDARLMQALVHRLYQENQFPREDWDPLLSRLTPEEQQVVYDLHFHPWLFQTACHLHDAYHEISCEGQAEVRAQLSSAPAWVQDLVTQPFVTQPESPNEETFLDDTPLENPPDTPLDEWMRGVDALLREVHKWHHTDE
jgi:hypothetical protein